PPMVRHMTLRWTSRRARLAAAVVGVALVAACSQTSPASDSVPGEVGDRASVRPAPPIAEPGTSGGGPSATEDDDSTPATTAPTTAPTTTIPKPPAVHGSTVWNTPVSVLQPGNP